MKGPWTSASSTLSHRYSHITSSLEGAELDTLAVEVLGSLPASANMSTGSELEDGIKNSQQVDQSPAQTLHRPLQKKPSPAPLQKPSTCPPSKKKPTYPLKNPSPVPPPQIIYFPLIIVQPWSPLRHGYHSPNATCDQPFAFSSLWNL